jgi:hypothetical protein
VRDLDATERGALVYLIAFDLECFDLGFALGTDNPGVGWSERVPASVRDASLPGPDGFASLAPLEPTGLVPPQVADRVVATFRRRFQAPPRCVPQRRARAGQLRQPLRIRGGRRHSEQAPTRSRHPLRLDDGSVEMKTWSRADDALLERIRSARQNGVPLLERDARPATPFPAPSSDAGRKGTGGARRTRGCGRSGRAPGCRNRPGADSSCTGISPTLPHQPWPSSSRPMAASTPCISI